MGTLFTRLVVSAFACLLSAGSASAALPTIGPKEVADFLRVVGEPEPTRDIAFEKPIVAALKTKSDLDSTATALAPEFALTPSQTRRVVELWILLVLYEKSVFFSYDEKVTREEQDRREEIFKSELRAAFIALVRETKHAPIAVTVASKALTIFLYGCERADFDAIVEGAQPEMQWLAAREADCEGFWLGINARHKMHPAILLRIAEYGLLSRAQRIAVIEYLRRQVPVSLTLQERVALDGYLARSLAYDYWEAGMVDAGLSLYEGLPADEQQYVRENGLPESVTWGGFSRSLARGWSEFPYAEAHQFHEQLASALLVRARLDDARKVLFEGTALGEEARSKFACPRTGAGDCERLDPRDLRWLYLDLVLNRPSEDPYDLFEQSVAGFTGWGGSGLWLEVLRTTARDSNYQALVERISEFWEPEDSSYRRAEWEPINATFDAGLQARIAELGRVFDERRRAMGSKPIAESERRTSRVAPLSPRFPEAKMPSCKGASPDAPKRAPKTLPDGFAPIRVGQRGEIVAAVSLSQNYDPSGEVSGGGYWVHLSRDGGKTWENPRYTGLSQFFPYEVQSQSCLPLIADDRLQVEVAVKEIDTASISYPPVGMRFRREQTGLYLDMPFAVLNRDTDGDGLTDIAEENLLLDATKADSDGDGFADGRDPFPNVRFSGKRGPNDEAMAAVLGALAAQGFGALIEPVEREGIGGWSAPALSLDRPLFLRANKNDFAGFSAKQMVLVYSDDDVERIARTKADFNAMWFGPLILNRAGTRGFISWSAGWVGGLFRVVKDGDKWRAEEISSWIT